MSTQKTKIFLISFVIVIAGAIYGWLEYYPVAKVGEIKLYRRDVRTELETYRRLEPANADNWDLALTNLISSAKWIQIAQLNGLNTKLNGILTEQNLNDLIQDTALSQLQEVYGEKKSRLLALVIEPAIAFKELYLYFRYSPLRTQNEIQDNVRLVSEAALSQLNIEEYAKILKAEVRTISFKNKKPAEKIELTREKDYAPSELGPRFRYFYSRPFIESKNAESTYQVYAFDKLEEALKSYQNNPTSHGYLAMPVDMKEFLAVVKIESADLKEKSYSLRALFIDKYNFKKWLINQERNIPVD